jgi:predicted nucleic acid-binding protein
MKTVFVDTVALVALWNDADQWHVAASAAFLRSYEQGDILVTTSCVLLECGNAMARTPRHDLVLHFRAKLQKSGHLIEPLAEDYEKAWQSFARHDAADAGIVDLISFEIMRRLHITHALTNDDHFRAAGFDVLM